MVFKLNPNKQYLVNQQNFLQAVPNDTKVQNINYFEIFKELDQKTWKISQFYAFLWIKQ